jgi:hypothetical protein
MGSRTRIRWTGVAKLAAGAIVCGALALTLPALLERPKPPPLPADVGFAPDRGPVLEGSLHSASVRSDHGHPDRAEPKRRPAQHDEKHADRREAKHPNAHHPAKPTEPAPTPVAAPPAPAPAPVPSPPVAPAPAPPPTVVQAATPTTSEEAPQPAPDAPGGPSEFGFEH